jgi:uncharacterized protein (DUF305 family)
VSAPEEAPAGRSIIRPVLLSVIALSLVLLGAGVATVLRAGTDTPVEDSVDVGFSRDMARHHLQGVEMANVALDRTTDPDIRQLAFDISSTQTNQVGRMEGWLSLWGVPPSGGETMAWMGEGGHEGHDMEADGGLMPGMATEAELDHLRELSGTDFDVEFLRLMIRHHQGGKDMAEYTAEHADVAAVRRLASTIADTQAAETTTMARMLTARGGTPLPAP